jgi:hypothetical protein
LNFAKMNRNAVLQKIFEPERRSGAFRLNSTTELTRFDTIACSEKSPYEVGRVGDFFNFFC